MQHEHDHDEHSAFEGESLSSSGREFLYTSEDEGMEHIRGDRRAALRWAGIIGLFVLAIAVLGIAGWVFFRPVSTPVDPEQPEETQTEQHDGAANPILATFTAPEVPSGEIRFSVSGEQFLADNGTLWTVSGQKFTATTSPCAVARSGDFCLVASLTESEPPVYAYAVKDAANFRVFEQASTATTFDVPGAAYAATLDAIDGVATAVVIADDGTGIMFSGEGMSETELAKLLSGTSVSEKK